MEEGFAGSSLFETRRAKGRTAYKLYVFSVVVGLLLIYVYRASQILSEGEGEKEGKKRWIVIGLFAAELWFGFYWLLSQTVRWNPLYRHPFKQTLSQRYEDKLPGIDVFVCTADPTIEPPSMVINTVLSVMAYDYPPEKLSVYLSDDGGSELTFYALLEASHFAKSWIPFCKKFKVEPRSPAAYFGEASEPSNGLITSEWVAIKHLYKEMEKRIDAATRKGTVPDDIRKQHKGFSEWSKAITSRDHQAILQILVDGRDQNTLDNEGSPLPTLVYMAREKRPNYHHNFKAGAMNALIRVSSEISNGAIILNVDCDMYSNNSEVVRDALCFFMDEEKGHEFAYVQLPQNFNNITKNDIHGASLKILSEELAGSDGLGGPLYIGSGCFHRRKSLCGSKYNEECKEDLTIGEKRDLEATTFSLEDRAKNLITCTLEDNTEWGKEMGLKYGCPVEDVITGFAIQCRGWKSIYYNPSRMGFLGVAPMTLAQTLVQHKRWSEGDFQIFLSKYCPLIYGHGKTKLGLQLCYIIYCFWAPCSFPTLYYVSIPSLSLLSGTSLFPNASSIWFIPFAYVIAATTIHSIGESLWAGLSIKAWWNEQRMWYFKRIASYTFAFIDSILKLLGVNKSSFVVTPKVADEEVSKRYEKEIMDFSPPSPMFSIIAMLAMLSLVCLIGAVKKFVLDEGMEVVDSFLLQFAVCVSVFLINIPVYEAMFFRNDSGRMPTSITVASVALALLAYVLL